MVVVGVIFFSLFLDIDGHIFCSRKTTAAYAIEPKATFHYQAILK